MKGDFGQHCSRLFLLLRSGFLCFIWVSVVGEFQEREGRGFPATAWRKSFITTDWRSSSQGSRVVDGFGVVCSIAAGRDVAAMADEGWSKSRGGKVGWVMGRAE